VKVKAPCLSCQFLSVFFRYKWRVDMRAGSNVVRTVMVDKNDGQKPTIILRDGMSGGSGLIEQTTPTSDEQLHTPDAIARNRIQQKK
jgi:hypothetical protein